MGISSLTPVDERLTVIAIHPVLIWRIYSYSKV